VRFVGRLDRIRRDFEARRLDACPDCRGHAIDFEFEKADPVGPVPLPSGPCRTCGKIRTSVRFRTIPGVSVEEAEAKCRSKRPNREDAE
jgi:hypothetical protein